MRVKKALVRLFSDVPFFYWLYFHLVRKHKGYVLSLFTSDTDYYFDSYPRSGNTFFSSLATRIFENKKAVHHLHKVAPIKMALNRNLPVLILFREPLECISSNYLKHFSMRSKEPPKMFDLNLLNDMADEYYYYYRFVLKINKKVHLIHFNNLIENTSAVIYDVSLIIGYEMDLQEIEKKVDILKSNYKGTSSMYGSSMPNKFKDEKKALIKITLENIPASQKCTRIYSQLLKIS